MADTVAELNVIVSAETDQLTAGLKSASDQVTSFGDSLKAGLGIGTGLAVVEAGVHAVGAAFGALKGSVIDFNQQLDQSRAVFTRYFEGNTAQADAFLTTLKGFAAQTPFEFKDLSTFAIRLQNANTNANDIIPTLQAIGNAASATGNLSTTSVDRITLALTQMQMKGKVSGDEMLQLTEANVPAWNILAEATGKPVAQLQKMASAGEISADVFVKAFRSMYENAGLMEGASKTLAGALSTVSDVGTQAFADIGRSLYDLATKGANAFANFLSSDDFQAWVGAAKIGVDALVGGLQTLLSALAPVGDVIAAMFHQLSTGDFSGAFATLTVAVQNALSGALSAVQAFAQQMFGAGADLIGQYASGIVEGASSTLQAAINVVADTIAAFLIGESPPPEGPLKDIAKGGAATIEAWGQGAAGAADAAVKPAAEAIAKNIGELKIAGRDADQSIRDLGQSIQDVERTSRDLKYTADDVKSTYDDQIKAVDDQIKSLQDAHDVQRDREKLELSLEEIQLRQAEIAAQGDPVLRAQLQTRLAELKVSDETRKNAEALDDAQKAISGTEKDRLKTQLEAQKMAQEEKKLQTELKTAKGPDRERIQAQLKEFETRKQISAAEAKDRQEAAARRVADATAKKDELTIQEQLNGMVDKSAIAEIAAKRNALGVRKEELSLAEQADKLNAQLAIAPLKDEHDRLVKEREDALKPLQDQLEALGKQKAALSDQRQEVQNYKADITAATQAWTDQEAAIKSAAAATKTAAANVPTPSVDKTFTPDAAAQAAVDRAKKAGENLAQAFSDGFSAMFDSVVPQALRSRLTSIGEKLQSEGLPGLIAVIGDGLRSAVPVFASRLVAWESAFIDWIGAVVGAIVPKLKGLLDTVLRWVDTSAGPIGDTLYAWTLAWLDWGTHTGLALMGRLADVGGVVLGWIGDMVIKLDGALVQWATAFVQWIGPKIPELLTAFGTYVSALVEWMGVHLGDLLDALGAWAVALVEWVGPKTPLLLEELGKLLVSVTDWTVQTALPAIAEKLATWALAIVEWVAPRIPLVLEELGKLLGAMSDWMFKTALPAIIEQVAKWGLQFIAWIMPVVQNLPEELLKIGAAVNSWIGDRIKDGTAQSFSDALKGWVDAFTAWPLKAGAQVGQKLRDDFSAKVSEWITYQLDPSNEDGIVGGAVKLGAGFLTGMEKGLSDHWGELKDWITENIGNQLPKWMKTLLGIESPSTVFADIGANLIAGLIEGMDSKQGDLINATKRIAASMGGEGGAHTSEQVTEWLKRAMDIVGVPDSWLSGLQWIVAHEDASGDPTAKNPGSTATGLFQLIDTTWADLADRFGLHNVKDPIDNSVAGIHYIAERYGTPDDAVEFWKANNYYAEGGWAGLHGPEIALLGERGPEYVIPNDRLGGSGEHQTMTLNVTIGGRIAEQIVVEGYQIAVRRGRLTGAA